jgi:hypothetical protein
VLAELGVLLGFVHIHPFHLKPLSSRSYDRVMTAQARRSRTQSNTSVDELEVRRSNIFTGREISTLDSHYEYYMLAKSVDDGVLASHFRSPVILFPDIILRNASFFRVGLLVLTLLHLEAALEGYSMNTKIKDTSRRRRKTTKCVVV